MKIGSIAHVHKNMLARRERGGADPRRAFRTHLGEKIRVPVLLPGHHVMAADAGEADRSLGYLCRRVVRTTRAVERRALVERGHIRLVSELGLQPSDDCADTRSPSLFTDDSGKRQRDVARLEIENGTDQMFVVA